MAGASIPLTPAVHQMIDIGPVPHVRAHDQGSRLPDRPRHGHEHVRAPARQRLRGRLVRPPRDPHGRRRHPVDRGVGAVADDAAVHPGGLRPAARGRPRALPRDRRRRVGRREARDQRPAVADAGRQPDHRRDARGQGPLVGGGDLDQGGARHRQGGRGVDDRPASPEIDPHGSDIARFYDHHKTAQHIAARASEGFNKTYGIVHPMEQWALEPADPAVARLRPPRRARRRVLRGGRLGAAVLVRHERVAARRVRRPGHAPPGRVGVALVVADHQRRAPRDARPGRARRPVGVRDLRRHRPGRAGRPRAPCGQPGRRRAGPDRLHAAAQQRRRDPRRPHDHAPGPRPIPGRHRRRHGHARQEDLPGRDAGRRLGPAPRRRRTRTRRSACGDRGRATSSVRRPTAAPTSATRASRS